MTTDTRARLRQLCVEPWHMEHNPHDGWYQHRIYAENTLLLNVVALDAAEDVMTLRTALPSLLDALDAADATIAELREALRVAELERDALLRHGIGVAGRPDFEGGA